MAENRNVVPPSVAVGYRVQIAGKQWMIYRSLTGKTSRTILGQHLLHEFVVGRFLSNGGLDTLLQIEPADE